MNVTVFTCMPGALGCLELHPSTAHPTVTSSFPVSTAMKQEAGKVAQASTVHKDTAKKPTRIFYNPDQNGLVKCDVCDKVMQRRGLGMHRKKHQTEQERQDARAMLLVPEPLINSNESLENIDDYPSTGKLRICIILLANTPCYATTRFNTVPNPLSSRW